jgi:ankyrin repeat protein
MFVGPWRAESSEPEAVHTHSTQSLPTNQHMALDSKSLFVKFAQPSTVFTVACLSISVLAIASAWRSGQRKAEVPIGVKGGTTGPTTPKKQGEPPEEEGDLDSTSLDEYLARIASLLTAIAKLNKSRKTAPDSPVMAHLGSELELSIAALCQIQQLLSLYYSVLSSQGGMKLCFETILASLSTIISTLDGELSTMIWQVADGRGGSSTQGRGTLKEIEDMTSKLKGQRESLLFIVDSLQRQVDQPGSSLQSLSNILESSSSENLSVPGDDINQIIEGHLGMDDLPPKYSPPAKGAPVPTDIKHVAPAPVEIDSNPISPSPKPAIAPSKIFTSIAQNDIEALTSLLQDGADPNLPHGRLQRTPIHECARRNRPQHAILLLKHGALADADDAAGDAPLHLACWEGAVDVASVILTAGNADINRMSGRDANTPLLCAIASRNIDMARLLLKHDARVAMKSGADDTTPLHQAAITAQPAMCGLLIARGADVDARDREGNTPLHYAATVGHTRTVKELLTEGADFNAQQELGITPLHWACHKGHAKVVALLIEAGANIDVETEDRCRPIHCAAKSGHLACVQALLGAGANISGEAEWEGIRGTPRELALKGGYKRIAGLLGKTVTFKT